MPEVEHKRSEAASFLAELDVGRFRWDFIHPFVTEKPADRAVRDTAIAGLTSLLASSVDGDAVDAARQFPAQLIPELAAKGYLAMSVPVADGGCGYPPYTTFRLLAAAWARSGAVGLMLAAHNALSVAAYLPALPPGPLRELILNRLAEGGVFGGADTEPTGAANGTRQTAAVPTDDRQGFVLSGEKVFITNAPIASLLAVSATIRDGDGERIDLFVVDPASPGFMVLDEHEFLGLGGAVNAPLRLDRVYVPARYRLVTADGGWRASPLVVSINAMARMCITTAPALAIAQQCLVWSRDFLARRRVDGRPLGEYAAIQQLLAESLADVFALESVVQWCLLGDAAATRLRERTAAKNIGTALGWRVVERTMSLFGAEGPETAYSKARRGVPAAPVERALRDLRMQRIAGGVDFNIDVRTAWQGIFSKYYAGPVDVPGAAETAPVDLGGAQLSAANRRHVWYAQAETGRLARFCAALTDRYGAEDMFQRQPALIAVNRLANELFTMSVTLARSARLAGDSVAGAQHLAEVYCAGARARIAALWRELEQPADADYATPSRDWLAGELPSESLFGIPSAQG